MTDDDILSEAEIIKKLRLAQSEMKSIEEGREVMIRWTRKDTGTCAYVSIPVKVSDVQYLVEQYYLPPHRGSSTDAHQCG